jgi:hypothetical protein
VLAEPSRSLLDRLKRITGCAQTHLSEFGNLGRVSFACPLGIPGLGIEHVSEIPGLEELLPSLQDILHASLREISHLGSDSLEPPVGFAE